LWRDGSLVRRFRKDDDGVVSIGALTDVEKIDPSSLRKGADEENVLRVAASWSVDPMTLAERDDVPRVGALFTFEPV
jgi:hypothetical protein